MTSQLCLFNFSSLRLFLIFYLLFLIFSILIYIWIYIYIYIYIFKLGNHCALKLEKAIKTSFMGFFSCYLSLNVPHGHYCMKTQPYGIKINPGVKMMKKSHCNYCLEKAICGAFLFNYCTLIFRVVQELLDVCNNWNAYCAWPFQ